MHCCLSACGLSWRGRLTSSKTPSCACGVPSVTSDLSRDDAVSCLRSERDARTGKRKPKRMPGKAKSKASPTKPKLFSALSPAPVTAAALGAGGAGARGVGAGAAGPLVLRIAALTSNLGLSDNKAGGGVAGGGEMVLVMAPATMARRGIKCGQMLRVTAATASAATTATATASPFVFARVWPNEKVAETGTVRAARLATCTPPPLTQIVAWPSLRSAECRMRVFGALAARLSAGSNVVVQSVDAPALTATAVVLRSVDAALEYSTATAAAISQAFRMCFSLFVAGRVPPRLMSCVRISVSQAVRWWHRASSAASVWRTKSMCLRCSL